MVKQRRKKSQLNSKSIKVWIGVDMEILRNQTAAASLYMVIEIDRWFDSACQIHIEMRMHEKSQPKYSVVFTQKPLSIKSLIRSMLFEDAPINARAQIQYACEKERSRKSFSFRLMN